MGETPSRSPPRRRALIAAAVLVALFALVLIFRDRLPLGEAIARYDELQAWVDAHRLLAAAAFIAAFALAAAASMPGGLWIAVLGGLLFGWAVGGACSWLAVMAGSCAPFALARQTERALPASERLDRFRRGFARSAAAYVVALRLLPIPYLVTNLVAGALGVSWRAFLAGSAIGYAPACFVFAALGEGARETAAAGSLDPRTLVAQPALVAGFAALAALSLVSAWLGRRLGRLDAGRDGLP